MHCRHRKSIETNQTSPEELSEFEHFSNHYGTSRRELNHIRIHERLYLNKKCAQERNQESFDETFRRFAKKIIIIFEISFEILEMKIVRVMKKMARFLIERV